MTKLFFLSVLTTAVLLLSSCSSVSIDEYQDTQPAIKLEDFFNGELVAYGMVRDRQGKLIRHFKAHLQGSWQEGSGTLDEVFWFNDGERQTRVWTMTANSDGGYTGTASDVEGSAVIQTKGQAIRLQYQLRIPYKGRELSVSMDDWMYQVAPGIVLNETVMTKWGFHAATITLVIAKKESLPLFDIGRNGL